ncbi:MAG: Wzz/FepE/Etk N-terminal domain-containing protein [Eubacteriales bacterium]|nr:Wzz/FepE/Etk N-terminal domain-containing protein [Eubacteriales bacterium]
MNEPFDDEIEIDLLALLYFLEKKWWMIVGLGAALAVTAFLVSTRLITPTYRSTTLIYVLPSSTSVTSLADIQISEKLAEDYLIIAKSNPVLDGTIERIQKERGGLTYTRSQINDKLSVNDRATRILEVNVVSENAEEASIIANVAGVEIVEQMAAITKSDPSTIVQKAEPALVPYGPDIRKNTLIGGAAGVMAAMAIVVIQFILNGNIKSEEDIMKYLGLKTLVVIPEDRELKRHRDE